MAWTYKNPPTVQCGICGEEFEATNYKSKYCGDECKHTARLAHKKVHYEKNFYHYKDYMIQKRFGITLDQYNALMESQDNRCAICKRPQVDFDKRFAVDHDHSTGEIRGLLCMLCNLGIGYFGDSEELLKNALNYLHEGKC